MYVYIYVHIFNMYIYSHIHIHLYMCLHMHVMSLCQNPKYCINKTHKQTSVSGPLGRQHSQRVQVSPWYIHRPQSRDVVTTSRPRYVPYTICHIQYTIYYTPFTIYHLLYTIYYTLCTTFYKRGLTWSLWDFKRSHGKGPGAVRVLGQQPDLRLLARLLGPT